MNINSWDFEKDGLAPITSVMDWDVVLGEGENKKPHVILRCEGRAHSWGEGPFDLYAVPREAVVFEGNTVLQLSEAPVAWYRRDWHVWGVESDTGSYIKTKWGDSQWRVTQSAYLTRNGVRFQRVCHSELAMALAGALALIPKLDEHPLNLFEFEWEKKATGREIRYHGEPAILERILLDRHDSQLYVRPKVGLFAPPPGWRNDDDDICTPEHWTDDYANGLYTELLTPDIEWHIE